jgi:hypothetical protein
MKIKTEAAASKLLTTVEALAWLIENVNDDDPNRIARFFRARNLWREAEATAAIAGIKADCNAPWALIMADDAPQTITLELTPVQAHRLAEHLRHSSDRYHDRPAADDVDWDGILAGVLEKADEVAPQEVDG